MTTDRGSMLLEVVIALAVGALLCGASLTLCSRFQQFADTYEAVLERDATLNLAPLLCSTWLSSAGSGRARELTPGVVVTAGSIEIWADVDGPGGFPDGDFSDPFEHVTVSAAGDSLRIRSGDGSSQPALAHVRSVEFGRPSSGLMAVSLSVAAQPKLRASSEELPVVMQLAARNWRENLFGE